MKLSKERISQITERLVGSLHKEGFLDFLGEKTAAIKGLDQAITYELLVEDRLNAEVRELMKAYETEIEKGRVDYHKMFTMIKNKLVKDRGLIL